MVLNERYDFKQIQSYCLEMAAINDKMYIRDIVS